METKKNNYEYNFDSMIGFALKDYLEKEEIDKIKELMLKIMKSKNITNGEKRKLNEYRSKIENLLESGSKDKEYEYGFFKWQFFGLIKVIKEDKDGEYNKIGLDVDKNFFNLLDFFIDLYPAYLFDLNKKEDLLLENVTVELTTIGLITLLVPDKNIYGFNSFFNDKTIIKKYLDGIIEKVKSEKNIEYLFKKFFTVYDGLGLKKRLNIKGFITYNTGKDNYYFSHDQKIALSGRTSFLFLDILNFLNKEEDKYKGKSTDLVLEKQEILFNFVYEILNEFKKQEYPKEYLKHFFLINKPQNYLFKDKAPISEGNIVPFTGLTEVINNVSERLVNNKNINEDKDEINKKKNEINEIIKQMEIKINDIYKDDLEKIQKLQDKIKEVFGEGNFATFCNLSENENEKQIVGYYINEVCKNYNGKNVDECVEKLKLLLIKNIFYNLSGLKLENIKNDTSIKKSLKVLGIDTEKIQTKKQIIEYFVNSINYDECLKNEVKIELIKKIKQEIKNGENFYNKKISNINNKDIQTYIGLLYNDFSFNKTIKEFDKKYGSDLLSEKVKDSSDTRKIKITISDDVKNDISSGKLLFGNNKNYGINEEINNINYTTKLIINNINDNKKINSKEEIEKAIEELEELKKQKEHNFNLEYQIEKLRQIENNFDSNKKSYKIIEEHNNFGEMSEEYRLDKSYHREAFITEEVIKDKRILEIELGKNNNKEDNATGLKFKVIIPKDFDVSLFLGYIRKFNIFEATLIANNFNKDLVEKGNFEIKDKDDILIFGKGITNISDFGECLGENGCNMYDSINSFLDEGKNGNGRSKKEKNLNNCLNDINNMEINKYIKCKQ